MRELQMLIDARERANEAADERQAAWDALTAFDSTMDNEQWFAIHNHTLEVQDYYDKLIRHVKFGEPYPLPLERK